MLPTGAAHRLTIVGAMVFYSKFEACLIESFQEELASRGHAWGCPSAWGWEGEKGLAYARTQ